MWKVVKTKKNTVFFNKNTVLIWQITVIRIQNGDFSMNPLV